MVASSTTPNSKIVLDNVWQPLAAGSKIYFVVDTARDPKIFPELSQLNNTLYRSLFAGTLVNDLASAAPYLVQLDRRTRFPDTIITMGWGNSWGIFIESSATLDELQNHLRGLLLVKDEIGRSLHFRFYDPRVLRVYLPTCNSAELTVIFGSITRFWVEDPMNNQLTHYSITNSKLTTTAVKLQPVSPS